MGLRHLLLLILLACAAISSAARQAEAYSKWMSLPSETLLKMARAYSGQQTKSDSALICYTIVAGRYTEDMSEAEKKMVIDACNGQWVIYFFSYYDYVKSNECLKKSLRICDESGFNRCRVYLNFGCMYQTVSEQSPDTGLSQKALDYCRMAFHEARKAEDWGVMMNAFGNMITISSSMGKLDSIESEMRIFLSTPQLKGNKMEYEYDWLLYEGVAALGKGENEKALRAFQRQIEVAQQGMPEYVRYVYLAYVNKVKALAAMRRFREAVDELNIAERLSEEYDMKDSKLETYKMMAGLYDSMGNHELMSDYRNKYFQLKDTLLNYRQLASVGEMNFLSQMKDIDERMEQMQRQREMQNALIFVIAVVTLIVVGFLILVARKNKRLRQANKVLYEKNVKILESEEQERRLRQEYEQLIAELKPAQKYKDSSLNEDMKEELWSRILHVMETDNAIFRSDFTSEQLADLVSSNYKYVSQVINEKSNCSFSVLLNECRIKEACKRINDITGYGNLTLEAVANSVGFKSRSSFIASFKRITGLTPSEYQRFVKSHHQER